MPDPTLTQVILTDLAYIREGVDKINGRLRESERAIAVLQWAVGLIGAVSLILVTAIVKHLWP